MSCEVCHGHGECVNCAGEGGWDDFTCPECNGSGQCFACDGEGKSEPRLCGTCKMTHDPKDCPYRERP